MKIVSLQKNKLKKTSHLGASSIDAKLLGMDMRPVSSLRKITISIQQAEE